MPVIQTGPDAAGGGGGDATAANQLTQINEAQDTNSYLIDTAGSTLKDGNNSSVFNNYLTQESVFKDNNQESVFKEDTLKNSVFKTPSGDSNFYQNGSVAFWSEANNVQLQSSNSILSSINLLNKNAFTNNGNAFSVNTNSNVITFSDVTLAGVGAQLQTFLRGVGIKTIISITFSSAAAAQHDVICVYVDF